MLVVACCFRGPGSHKALIDSRFEYLLIALGTSQLLPQSAISPPAILDMWLASCIQFSTQATAIHGSVGTTGWLC